MAFPKKKIVIITAPSGSGKTSVVKHLMNKIPQLTFSVSATTRPKRQNEIEGRDYYFITEDNFREKIKNKDFMEWEMVYEGKYYGTLKSEMKRIWDKDRVPVLDIDVKGAIHVRKQYPEETISLFIQPPSLEVLKNRLQERGTETPESLQTRISKAAYELSFKDHFDHTIINDDLARACNEAEQIIKSFLAS